MHIEDQTAFEAMKLAYSGEYEKAIEKFEDFLKREPNQIQMMGELCNCYAETKRYEDLEKLASRALLISQNRASTDNIGRFYGYLGKSYLYRDDYVPAAKYYRLAIANKPHFIPNYQELAYSLFYQGQYEETVELFKQIIDMNPDYAKDYEIEKKIGIVFDTWNEKDPSRNLFVSGFHAENEKNYSLAKIEYKKCLEHDPDNLEALFGLFSIAKEENVIHEAICIGESLFKKLQRFEYKNKSYLKPPLYIGLSILFQKLDDFEKSAEYGKYFYTTVLMDDAKKALEEKNYDEALKLYLKALGIGRNSFDVLDKIIDYYYILNKIDKIAEYLDSALKLAMNKYDNGRVADYCLKFAKYFALQHNQEQAQKYCELAANSSTDLDFKLKANNYIGTMLYIVEDYSEALKFFECCEKLVSKGAVDKYDIPSSLIKTRNMLDENSDMRRAEKRFLDARKLRMQENFEAAAKEYEASLAIRPQVLEVMWELAYCYMRLGKLLESSDVSEEAFKVSMQSGDNKYAEPLAYNVGLYNLKTRNYEKALKYFTESQKFNPENEEYKVLIEECRRNILGDNTVH